jgi:hypothetical protein
MTVKPGHQTTGNVRMIWLDESSFTMFSTSGRVYIWRAHKEAYNLECLVATVKHGEDSVMVWAAMSWYSILLVPLLPFMAELLWGSMWTGWVIRCIPWSRHYFRTTVHFSKMTMLMQFSKMAVSTFTQLELFSHGSKSMKMNLSIFPGQHNHQM